MAEPSGTFQMRQILPKLMLELESCTSTIGLSDPGQPGAGLPQRIIRKDFSKRDRELRLDRVQTARAARKERLTPKFHQKEKYARGYGTFGARSI